jgi:hypothetical protein
MSDGEAKRLPANPEAAVEVEGFDSTPHFIPQPTSTSPA